MRVVGRRRSVEPIRDDVQLAAKATECSQLVAAEDWQALRDCGNALGGMTGGTNDGKIFVGQALREATNKLAFGSLTQDRKNGPAAAAAFKRIKPPSVYAERSTVHILCAERRRQ